MWTRRQFLRTAALASGSGLGLGFYTFRWEPHWLEIVERPLPIARLPIPWTGARLAQLSDLHIGSAVAEDYLRHTFERVRRLAPDVVAYTGDFASAEAGQLDALTRLAPLLPRGRKATLGILGNHDYGRRWAQEPVADSVAAIVAAAGVRILRNETAALSGLHIVGLDDLWAGRFDAVRPLAALNPDTAAIALSHNPDTADLPVWGSFAGWILAGHTHGGQCKPPFLPPPLLPVANRRYTAGEFALPGGRRMYINRGIGHTLPVRFNVRPEVTLFTLVRA